MAQSFNPDPVFNNSDSSESALLEESKIYIRRELDDHPCKWEVNAAALKVDISLLSHCTSKNKPGCMPIHRLVRWTKVMGPGLLRWLARKCGFELVPLNDQLGCPEPIPLIALFSAKAGAAVGETLSDVASDGRWDDDERRADLVGWLKVQSIVNGIVDGIEESLKAKAS